MALFLPDIAHPIISLIDASDLPSAALVCKPWSLPSQRRLFQSVELSNKRKMKLFCFAVDRNRAGGRGKRLGDFVRVLDIFLVHQPQPSLRTRILAKHLPLVLNLCPYLYELRIAINAYGHLDESILDSLRCTPPIKALRVKVHPSWTVALNQLLTVWPSVEHLSVKTDSPPVFLPQAQPPPFKLYEFRQERWAERDSFSNFPSEWLKWVLSNSMDTLRILQLAYMPPPETLDGILDTTGPRLRSLALDVDVWQPSTINSLRNCTSLEELRTRAVPSLEEDILPKSVVHLSYVTNIPNDNHKAVRVQLPNLRVVSCHSVPGTEGEKFVEQCESLGIQGRLGSFWPHAQIITDDELVPAVNGFPRTHRAHVPIMNSVVVGRNVTEFKNRRLPLHLLKRVKRYCHRWIFRHHD